ncbi:MAG: GxxExxY protein [Candidatus Cloacimonetes bacterium]|nr:GxxExxY protein [Candidatus Cloacimonadota bacterium]MCF7812873.1 GxxExxY protein [Candidatus Cloacimonadota bacterium]MCF7867085.1 GxxExxY protein [Candidatus Cloacimonadota bacterium]MCF7882595.1 GxxExxY protein [Candidatus Cloacimonadota bacterium]
MKSLIYMDECYKIKKACIEVRKRLGNGFLEKVYERALVIELQLLDFFVESQKLIQIVYRGEVIADYKADLIIDEKIIIELKCENQINKFHKAQLFNYLKATGYKLGVIINFPNNRKGFDFERIPNIID